MSIEWEYLGTQTLPPGSFSPWTVQTWRCKVPGGWLVMVIKENHQEHSLSTTFLPDTAHEWNGSSLPQNAWANP